MEVHSYAHHEGRKKWTHYLWEFLMLFLAVYCGFLAENIREHKVEHGRAKQFAQSLLSDLKADTAVLVEYDLMMTKANQIIAVLQKEYDLN